MLLSPFDKAVFVSNLKTGTIITVGIVAAYALVMLGCMAAQMIRCALKGWCKK